MEIKYETKYHKTKTISKWKYKGVVYDDWDELYYKYIRTLKCCSCNKEFNNSYERCLDHDHSTGLFRAIVCRGCNNHDRYINYPDGYDKKIYNLNNKEKIKEYKKDYSKQYYISKKEKIKKNVNEYTKKNKEKIEENEKEKINCECGGKYTYSHKQRHLKTIKHIVWYMEQVD